MLPPTFPDTVIEIIYFFVLVLLESLRFLVNKTFFWEKSIRHHGMATSQAESPTFVKLVALIQTNGVPVQSLPSFTLFFPN